MRKFIVHTRPIPGRPKTEAPTIVEVEGEVVSAMQDPSVMWLPNHEYKFRILTPEFLHETRGKETIPAVYCSHSVHHTVEEARKSAEAMVQWQFDLEWRKHGRPINPIEVLARCQDIQVLSM